MKHNSGNYNRRSHRWRDHNYSLPGWYYVTLVTYNRERLFGRVVQGKMILNDMGHMVRDEWEKTAIIRSEIQLDAYVVMPDHLHGIIVIINDIRRDNRPVIPTRPVVPTMGLFHHGPVPKSIGAIMSGFKSVVTKRINTIRQTPGRRVWQRNYWDRVIRDDLELRRIRKYILDNPLYWKSKG